jgi:hypothetical protein
MRNWCLENKRILFFLFLFVILVRCAFIVSFPLNFGGDGSIYYTMMLEKHSNLIMAQGYPFFFMFPYHFLRKLSSLLATIPQDPRFEPWWVTSKNWLIGNTALDAISWAALFQDHFFILFQHLIEFLVLLCGYKLVRKYFGHRVSLIFLILYGISPLSLEDASSCRPEWFQGALLVFWVYLAERLIGISSPKKMFYYAVLGGLCGLGFLVKFNSLPLFLIFVCILLFFDRGAVKQWREGILKISTFGLAAVALVWSFTAFYHKPTTRTSTLTVNSWILADKAFQFMPVLELCKDNGLYTKRLMALKRGLPLTKGEVLNGTYFRELDVLAKIRIPYRNRLSWVMNASEKELSEYFLKNGVDTLYEQQSLLHIAYYIGLEEYGELLRKMYVETIKNYPFSFLEDTFMNFFRSFSIKERSLGYFPLYDEVLMGRARPITHHFGYVKFLWPSDRGICYHENACWLPGAWFFTKLTHFWPPNWVMWFFSFVALFTAIRFRNSQPSFLTISIMLIVLAFVAGSNMINNEFRIKDYRCIHLFVTAIAAVGVFQSMGICKEFLRGISFRRKLLRSIGSI